MSDSHRSSETSRGPADGGTSERTVARKGASLGTSAPLATTSYGQGAAGLGLTFAASVAAFAFLGLWLDRRFGWSPWATLGLSLFGVFSGMTWLVVKASAVGSTGGSPAGGSTADEPDGAESRRDALDDR